MVQETDTLMPENTPTTQQKSAISNIESNLPVTAGAGSGKTFVLTHRYFQILAERKANLDEILAITFTEKAANQMKEKIRNLIRRFAHETVSDEFPPVRKPGFKLPIPEYWQSLLDTFDRAYISTIHGFCARLLRDSAIQSGLDPEFSVMDEQHVALHQPEIIRRTVFQLIQAENPAAAYLLRYYSPASIIHRLSRMIQQRIQYQGIREFYLGNGNTQSVPVDTLYQQLVTLFEEEAIPVLDQLSAHPGWEKIQEEIRSISPRDESDKFYPHWLSLQEKMEQLHQSLSAVERANIWIALQEDLKQKGRKSNWEGGDFTEIKQDLYEFREEVLKPGLAHLAVFREEDEREAIHLAQALADLFHRTLERYQNWKRQHNFLDYDDLLIKAADVLKAYPAIRSHYARQFKQILVDEFQDTNPLQYELVRLLALEQTESAKVCLVGDPKQSIYRFRGTEVSLFDQAKQELRRKEVALQTSFRSLPSLLSWFDACFAPLMGNNEEDTGNLAPFEQHYLSLQPNRSEQPPASGTVAVQLVEVNRQADDSSMESRIQVEAAHIADWLLRDLPTITIEADNTERPAAYGDVAILFRRTSYIKYYEYALQLAGIPYYTVAGKGFFQKPEIQDLLNILRGICHPTDEIAIVGSLRSTIFGISDEGLFWLAETGSSWQDILYSEDFRTPGNLPDSDDFVLRYARRLMAGWQRAKDRISPEELLESICTTTGYLGILGTQDNGSQHIRNVEQFLNLASEFGLSTHTSLDAFITYIETISEQSDTEEATLYFGNQDAVQLLTIHKSKGLEFPVVILPNIDYTGQNTLQKDFYPEFGLAVSWNDPRKSLEEQEIKPFLYQYIRGLERRQELAESKRLFYVACTRARDYLLLSGLLNGPDGLEKVANKVDRQKDNWMHWTLATLTDSGWAPGEDSADIKGSVVRVLHHDHSGASSVPRITEILQAPSAHASHSNEGEVGDILSIEEIQRRWSISPAKPVLKEINPSMLPVFVNNPEEFDTLYIRQQPETLVREGRTGATGGAEYGTLIHKILESHFNNPARGVEEIIDSQLALSRFQEDPAVRSDILQLMHTFLNSSLYLDICRFSVYPEVPFFTQVDGVPMNGQIDLIIEDEAYGLRIVDYKTDQVSGDEIMQRADYYKPQLCAYAFGILQSTGQWPGRVDLYFWRTGQTVPVSIEDSDIQDIHRYIQSLKRFTSE